MDVSIATSLVPSTYLYGWIKHAIETVFHFIFVQTVPVSTCFKNSLSNTKQKEPSLSSSCSLRCLFTYLCFLHGPYHRIISVLLTLNPSNASRGEKSTKDTKKSRVRPLQGIWGEQGS